MLPARKVLSVFCPFASALSQSPEIKGGKTQAKYHPNQRGGKRAVGISDDEHQDCQSEKCGGMLCSFSNHARIHACTNALQACAQKSPVVLGLGLLNMLVWGPTLRDSG